MNSTKACTASSCVSMSCLCTTATIKRLKFP
uniref:Uncharacterized protein n=1 Tax=Arundo donax TaxID=35708 RepID=A0A0A9GX36_ARUDO